MKTIDVILAAYNGSDFIKDQILSILVNFEHVKGYTCRLLISDDQSSDDTVRIINEINITDSRVQLLDSHKKGGVKHNFYHLMNYTDADYVFFCDQDDLWLPEKMSIFIERFEKVEREFDGPLLIHSDLCVADSSLSPINVSMFEYQNINKNPSLEDILVSNSITGCVMACNKKVIDAMIKSSIVESIMHDWYIGLFAASFGRISFIDRSLILYRQHEHNQVGAKSFAIKDIFKFKDISTKINSARESVLKSRLQSALFLNDFEDELELAQKTTIKKYVDSFDLSVAKRANMFFSGKVKKKGILRNAFFFLFYVLKI